MAAHTPRWTSKFGFYLIAVGSAFGLGNLWRFPYIVGENGGGAFIILYVLLSITVGCALLIAELMLGKTTHSSLLKATRLISNKVKLPTHWLGRVAMALSFLVLAYYSVISGWVIHFFTQFLMSLVKIGDLSQVESQSLSVLIGNGWLQFLLASVHIVISIVVVAQGVKEGLEKWLTRLMPIFAALVVILVVRAMSLPSRGDVLRFLFYPDFTKLTLNSLSYAIGHVCFTLSIGFGTIVTFSRYLEDEVHLPTIGFRITALDTVVSLVAALLIFPIAFQSSSLPVTDPMLLFEALPKFFNQMKGGEFFGLIFFLCLWLAALNASIGLLETLVANLKDFYPHMKRPVLSWASGGLVLFLTLIPALSGTVFKNFRLHDLSILQVMDVVIINWALPFSAFLIGLSFYYSFDEQVKSKLFISNKVIASEKLYADWNFLIKYVTPSVLILALVLQVIRLLV